MTDENGGRSGRSTANASNDNLMEVDDIPIPPVEEVEDTEDSETSDEDEDHHQLINVFNGGVAGAANRRIQLSNFRRLRSQNGGMAMLVPPSELLFQEIRAWFNKFTQSYRVMSARHLKSRGHTNLESGGKVILPPDALEMLSRSSSALTSPMMFKATNPTNPNKFTHCGVLEFIAEENRCYMPSWMMDSLDLQDHDWIQIDRVELPTATFAKFQPQSTDFLEISDPRAVLENALRFFACLTKGDMITIHYNSKMYKMLVLEMKPSDAVSIIECDMNVDFAAPVGYVSPSPTTTTSGVMEEEDSGQHREEEVSGVFGGIGNRLNGKSVVRAKAKGGRKAILPDDKWQIGKLQFNRRLIKKPAALPAQEKKFTAFGGVGLSLRSPKKNTTAGSF